MTHAGVLVIFKNQLIFMEMCLWFMTAKKDAKRFFFKITKPNVEE